jgi:hypothetical protein
VVTVQRDGDLGLVPVAPAAACWLHEGVNEEVLRSALTRRSWRPAASLVVQPGSKLAELLYMASAPGRGRQGTRCLRPRSIKERRRGRGSRSARLEAAVARTRGPAEVDNGGQRRQRQNRVQSRQSNQRKGKNGNEGELTERTWAFSEEMKKERNSGRRG